MNNEIEKLNDRIDALEKRIQVLEGYPEAMAGGGSLKKKQTVREFLLSKTPGDDVRKVLVIGYFLEKFESMISFNAKDLEKAFEQAKEKVPSNINDKVNLNIKKGHIGEVGEKKESRKAWHLTNSGETFVENNFKQSNS